MDDNLFRELKAAFMDAYDKNRDGRLDINELAQLLPLESGFQLLFMFDNQVDSSVEFMRVSAAIFSHTFSHYFAGVRNVNLANNKLTANNHRAALDQVRHRLKRLY